MLNFLQAGIRNCTIGSRLRLSRRMFHLGGSGSNGSHSFRNALLASLSRQIAIHMTMRGKIK